MESVPNFLGDAKIHAWYGGSEMRGQAAFGVYFPHAEFPNVSEPVESAQTNNRAEVLAIMAAIKRVPESLYSDSKWCVGIFFSSAKFLFVFVCTMSSFTSPPAKTSANFGGGSGSPDQDVSNMSPEQMRVLLAQQ